MWDTRLKEGLTHLPQPPPPFPGSCFTQGNKWPGRGVANYVSSLQAGPRLSRKG